MTTTGMKVHDFYRKHGLRVHEIKRGKKNPDAMGWPDTPKRADDVEPLLDGVRFNKYGWILDDSSVVIDIDVHDPAKNGYESLTKLESEIGFKLEDAAGAIVETPSGGRHYYFTKPADEKFGKTFAARYPGIDFISGKGSQVVAANSCHDSHPGKFYEMRGDDLLEMPRQLIELLKDKETKPYSPPSHQNSDLPGDEFNKSYRGLMMLVGELSGRGYTLRSCGDYFEYDRPGKQSQSKQSGFVGKKSDYGNYQLTGFSESDSNFPAKESMTIFHAYAKLVHGGDGRKAAMTLYDAGFAESDSVDLSGLIKPVATPVAETVKSIGSIVRCPVPVEPQEAAFAKPVERPTLCDSLLYPPGVLGDMVRYIVDTARHPHPEMTLAACLAFSGMVLGRRVRGADDTRPNLYCLSIAESGTGKNHARNQIKRFMQAAGIHVPAEGMASATGLVKMLQEQNSVVVQMDEAGMQFRAMRNKSGPQSEVGAYLSELYTSSHGLFTYKAYASSENNIKIDQPHLSINAITTENTLYKGGFNHDDIEQGIFGRFLLFRPKVMDPPERYHVRVNPLPAPIVEAIKSWWDYKPWDIVAGANFLPDHPEPMVVEISDEALNRYIAYADAVHARLHHEDTFDRSIWRRSREKTNRLALVHACMKDGKRDNIVIGIDSMDWAIALSNYSTRSMRFDILNAIVESEYQDKIRYFISKIPKDGIEWWALSRKLTKLHKKERNDIRVDLVEIGSILQVEQETGGKPKTIIRAA